jgi:hypothetical protein
MSAYLVEKIIKKYKSHRGATGFDLAYINAIVNDMKSGKSGEASRYYQQRQRLLLFRATVVDVVDVVVDAFCAF